MRARTLIVALLAALALAAPALAEPVATPHVESELHAARAAIAPGERFWVVLRQQIIPGWHTYWRNPGDSGQATSISWRLPPGFSAGPIGWPAPSVMPYGGVLTNYGYSGEVLYPIEITAPARLGPGAILFADVQWLVCSDQCIPEQATLPLRLNVAAPGRDDPTWAPIIARAVAALPKPLDVDARIGASGALSIALPNASAIRNPYFFPFDTRATDHSAAQQPRIGAGGVSFTLKAGADHAFDRPLDGVLAYETRDGESWMRHAVEIHALAGGAVANTADAAAAVTNAPRASTPAAAPPVDLMLALPSALLCAFLGGLILNIMPCVLPVLSIKALSFAGGAHSGEARRHGLVYAAGVLATFILLAVVLMLLRGAGEAVGWGFQLQMPLVTAAGALLFFAIGLNLVGAFEIGGGAQGIGAGLAAKGGDLGAFFTGALAVVAATPCSAPFMAGAVGFAVTQPPAVTLVVFVGLAVGFAAPLTLLSFAPALQRLIPKPGAWMERVRNVLAFPMFAAAIWLAWVLAAQTGPSGVAALASLALALAFAIFVSRWGRLWLAIGVVAIALTAAFALRPITTAHAAAPATAESWSVARVAEARSAGRPVFVNFTAAWCVTCHVNEALAFTPRVKQAMADAGVVYLEGDWTNRDDAISAELARHSRAGVPLYLYYAPGAAEPVVLPQVLSEHDVLAAIGSRQ